MNVYLTERCSRGPAEVLGIFSTPERGQEVCQDKAGEYFGRTHTDPLTWRQSRNSKGHYTDAHFSASYHHPGDGMWLFQITRYTVDEAREDTS